MSEYYLAMNSVCSYNVGPYAWVKYVPGEPILPNQPNEGSVKRRNEKKRMRLRREFISVQFSFLFMRYHFVDS